MRAFQVTAINQDPQLTNVSDSQPGQGQIRIRNAACGLNFADLLMIKGRYQDTPEPPFTLGMEAAGIVETLGPGVDGPAPGTRVAVFGGSGGLADFGIYPADRAVVLPDSVSFTTAAALQVAYGTSHVALDYRVNMQPGENLLVLGGAGGVGLTAVEIGKLMGANVIACARGGEKLEIAKRTGADHLIDSETDDIREVVKSLGGADVVYDPVGGDQFKAAMRACNPEARLLPLGFASGDVPQIPANILLVKNLTVHGFYWGGYRRFKPEVLANSLRQLFAWWEEGKLKPHVSNHVPLENAVEALDLLTTRKATGKVVVEIG